MYQLDIDHVQNEKERVEFVQSEDMVVYFMSKNLFSQNF